MNKNTSLLSIAMTILLSTTMVFTADNNNDRYNEIVTALSSLSENFVFHSNDIQVVETHKAALQKELDSYKNSWIPIFFKVFGAGYGLETVRRGIDLAICAHPIVYKAVENAWFPISRKLYYLNYPVSRPVAEVNKLIMIPAINKIVELYDARKIGKTTGEVVALLVFALSPLATGLIAKYLFTNCYQTEIARLEEEIKTDDAIITALQNQ